MIYSIKRFSALDETRTFSTKGLRLKSKLFGGMRSFYRNQARTVTNPDRFKPGPDNRTQAQKDAILKTNGISTPSALDRGIAGFEQGMTSLGTSMGKGVTAVGSVLGKAENAIGQGASAVGRGIQSGVRTGKVAVGRAAQSAGSGISGAFRSVGNLFRRKPTTISVMAPVESKKLSRDNWVLQQAGVTDPTKLTGKAREKALAQARTQSRSTGDKRTLDLGTRGSVLTPQDGSSYGGFGESPSAKRFIARKEEMLARLTPEQRKEFDRKMYLHQQETAMIEGRAPIPQGYQFQVLAKPGGSSGGSQQQPQPTITGSGTQQPAQSKPAGVPQPQTPQSGGTGGSQPQAQPKPQVTGGGTPKAQPKPMANPQQPAQQGKVGQWFKNAGQRTWNGVKTAGKIGMIGGTAAAGLGAYALYKTATSDSDD